MGLTSNQLAILTARCGVMRCGASRCGFAPHHVQGTTPGSTGPYYVWKKVYPPTTTYTIVRTG